MKTLSSAATNAIPMDFGGGEDALLGQNPWGPSKPL
jgi:hypothetical protein